MGDNMNSEEILNLLKQKKYLITLDEYLKIVKSPQVRTVHCEKENFNLITDDNYVFTFKIINN